MYSGVQPRQVTGSCGVMLEPKSVNFSVSGAPVMHTFSAEKKYVFISYKLYHRNIYIGLSLFAGNITLWHE